jgi:enoyl-CoA hydratase/carnithine racemase
VTTETRLAHIAGLMRTLRWRRGVTGPQLAAEWGLTEQRVRTLAAEASKLVRAEIEDPNYVAVTLEMTLERIVLEGKDKDRIAAAKVWASLQPQRDSDADEGDERSPDAQLAIAKALVTALESKP